MSFDINISKIKCSGKHGIYNHEKQSEQEFLVDIHIYISDFFEDNINKTINYEEIVDLVIKIVSTKSFDLIDKLIKFNKKKIKNLRLKKICSEENTIKKFNKIFLKRDENSS